MSDIDRADPSDLVLRNTDLKRQWLSIQISEKEIQLKQHDIALERLQTVEIKKALHAKEKCKKQLEELKQEFEGSLLDVFVIKKGGT